MTPLYTKSTRDIAYLAGLIGADGSLEVNEPYITIASADKNFLRNLVQQRIEGATHRRIRIFQDRSAKVYKLRVYDRELWKLLQSRYKVPCGAKSRRIIPPITLTKNEETSYLQGWFDGEGWIEVLRRRTERIHNYPRVGFKVRSKAIRNWIREVLSKRGVRTTAYDRADGTFGIWINGIAASERFRREIGFGYVKKNEALASLVEKCRESVSA
jgi:hypothetical protein